MKDIKFKIFDATEKTFIGDETNVDVFINRGNGTGQVVFGDRSDLEGLLFTGYVCADGTEVYEGDIVRMEIQTERGWEPFTENVHWTDGAWRFGNFTETPQAMRLLGVEGNVRTTPWPAATSEA